MARNCSICTHSERKAIDKALVAGEPLRDIEGRFGTSRSALARHKSEHLPKLLAKAERKERHLAADLQGQADAQDAKETATAIDVMAELQRVFARAQLLFDACDRWLRDPDSPDQYSIEPRGDDINVIVWERGPNGQAVQKKRKMSYLLARLAEGDVAVERWETKHADPRDLVLKVSDNLKGQLELVARLIGLLDTRAQVNVLINHPEWVRIKHAINDALEAHPAARLAVAQKLQRLGAA